MTQIISLPACLGLLIIMIVIQSSMGRPQQPGASPRPRPARPTRPPGGLFAHSGPDGAPKPAGAAIETSTGKPFGGLLEALNYGQFGTASAGGAGNGAVDENGEAIGQGTGVAQAGQGGFGIGLGIGGAIATPLGNLAFGQAEGVAVGK